MNATEFEDLFRPGEVIPVRPTSAAIAKARLRDRIEVDRYATGCPRWLLWQNPVRLAQRFARADRALQQERQPTINALAALASGFQQPDRWTAGRWEFRATQITGEIGNPAAGRSRRVYRWRFPA